ADEVAAVDPLVGLRDDRVHTEQAGALGGPVARGAGAVLLAREDDERDVRRLVVLAGLEDRRLLPTAGEVPGEATLDAVQQLVLLPDVGVGAADHVLLVATARAVGVEVLAVDAVLLEVDAGRAVGLDRAGRADVVGRDRVTQQRQHARTGDVLDRVQLLAHP